LKREAVFGYRGRLLNYPGAEIELKTNKINQSQEVFFWVLLVVLSLLGFIYSTKVFQTVPVTFPRETVFFTLSALAICFAALRGGSPLRGQKKIAFWLLTAFAAWSVLAIFWAANSAGHSRRLVELVFFCGWAFALSALAVPLKRVELVTYWLGFFGGVIGIAVAGGMVAFDTSLGVWPFGNANAAGMFCAFAAVINTGLFLKSIKKYELKDPKTIIPAACAVMALIGLCCARSKGAFLGLIVGEAVLAWRFAPKHRKWVAACTAAVLLTGVLGYLYDKDWEISGTTSGFRVKAYKSAISQIGGAPIGGTGLGSFYAYFPKYSLPELSGHPKMGDTVFHAHSNILEIGTELGIVGMVLFIALVLFIGVLPLIRKNKHEDERTRFESIWIAGFLTISVHALFAVHFYWTEAVLYFWTSVGILLALGRKEAVEIKINKRIPMLVILLISLAGLWYVGVFQEFVGRMHVARRELNLKTVRKLDRAFENMGRKRMSNTPQFQQLKKNRIRLYSSIIADLNEELRLVHVQRMRSDTYYQLGSAYYNIGYPREALYFFRLVVKDAPGYVNTDYFLGRAYEGLYRKESRLHKKQELKLYQDLAVESLERYLASNVRAKMSGEATVFLANIYAQRKQFTEAIKVINKHLEYKPDSNRQSELVRLRNSIVARLAAGKKKPGK